VTFAADLVRFKNPLKHHFLMVLRFTLFFASFLAALCAAAQDNVVNVTDADLVGGETYNWTNDNTYVLDGLVFLESGGRLNIQEGTVIQGRGASQVTTGDNTSALIITRGAQIFAEGTADQPIIFTAEGDDLTVSDDLTAGDRGEWGGLIVLGSATVARPTGTDNIEGIAVAPRTEFGGTNDEDNSGVIRYVSIRHGGAQLSTDNEINGLTLGGVGSGTTVEYVEVFANEDDGIEWFGGTVSVKYATVAFCGDDGMDYDYGWRGNGQFWFVIQAPETGTGRSGEHDGASPDDQQPFSRPTIYNATYVGIGESNSATGGDANRENPFSVVFRDNAGGYYRNSLFTGFNGAAIGIEDRRGADTTDAFTRFQMGDLDLTDNIFEDFAGIDSTDEIFIAIDQDEAYVPASTTELATALNGRNTIGASGIAGISRTPDGGLDPRINAGGEALTGGAVNEDDEFFSLVSYRGAFGNRVNWLQDWTALDAYGYLGDLVEPVDFGDCIDVRDADLVGGDTTNWIASECYNLDGLVFLEEDGVLNIEAGTQIFGLGANDITTGDNTSALIIARGAKIFANGTAEAPIVFTAAGDDPDDPNDFGPNDRGAWGGVIVLGNATVARPGGFDNIEGIAVDDPNNPNEGRTAFGGNDDEDDSGEIRYMSIRHGGAQLSTDNEINGLTLGGVGSGTTIEYVEVFANEDDGIEWFGGTVRVNYAAVSFCGDDGMDYDYGWRGGGQYWFVLQGPNSNTGRAGEHDGASPDDQQPFSEPTIYNATYIGIGQNATATGGDANRTVPLSVLFRDNAGGHYNNSIFTDYNGYAIGVEDRVEQDEGDALARLQAEDLTICNSIFFGFGQGNDPEDIFVAVNPDDEIVEASSPIVVDAFSGCGNIFQDPVLNDIASRDEMGGFLDPRPYAFDTVAAMGAPEAAEGFESVAYYGAFEPGAYSQSNPSWIDGWTAASSNGLVSDQTNNTNGIGRPSPLLSAPAPNPASEMTRVSFNLPAPAEVRLTVMDLNGRPLATRVRAYAAGEQSEMVNVSALPAGTYLIVLDVEGNRQLQKLVIAR
jgi:hypothetical protein